MRSWHPAEVGFRTRRLLANWGYAARLFGRLWLPGLAALARFRLVSEQIFFLGNRSLTIIAVSGFFVGSVLSLQLYYILQSFGSAETLGMVVALALVRELGPVITALLFAGRAGTSLTAEIGLMRAGEQLSAMEMMAVDPVQRILAPRFFAGIIALPLLVALFNAVGIFGSWLVGVVLLGVDSGAFWGQMQSAVTVFGDLRQGFVKSLVFGVAVTFVALLQGYVARPTPEGVSQATTRTVVLASVWAVLALNFLLTAVMFTP
ncbi:ABC transporter permease [Lampropedia cohaerens]|uniref:Intermembrane phospholipid transport system permease protein MlaE n=1 Tax=Lampropedia cohaerens TaxID=1610491 RepID=A0A0U1Q373_9BURK|nr:lipid asymmetry maintenance ABC transporter permease subunit MlaE [Lampropedia cohaerens]KKW69223.1 ABC transporter permease [Lampropedia cohaerens]